MVFTRSSTENAELTILTGRTALRYLTVFQPVFEPFVALSATIALKQARVLIQELQDGAVDIAQFVIGDGVRWNEVNHIAQRPE